MLKPVHLICKLPTMTSNDILRADVLDILFENRNKQYGAYTLRKYYNNRLAMALGIALTIVALAAWLIQRSTPDDSAAAVDWKPDPMILTLVDPAPESEPPVQAPPPSAQPRPIATQAFNARIEIVAHADPADMVPDMADLVDRQIGNTTVEGDLPTQNRTIEAPPLPPVESGGGTEQEVREFRPLERQPEFPGGVQAWSAFLSRHLRMPEELEAGERRTIQVRFWVGADGSLTHFEVVQSAGTAFDNEVIRVLKKMPRWKPAFHNGQPVAVTFTQPVTFQALEE
jgi:periplasmic protein TonB